MKARINPEPFAEFLFKLSETENKANNYLTWISTHPDSKERAEYIIEYCKAKKTIYTGAMTTATWDKLKDDIKEL